jgi:heme/copper-type cytochrome/quinol oxidase subunit 2
MVQDQFFEVQNFKHSLPFELVWGTFPSIIIWMILLPSLYLLYSLDEPMDPKYNIKVIGHQWYWSYEFDNFVEVENNHFEFASFKYNSNIIDDASLKFGTKRLLEVDKRLVVPINVPIRFLIASGDVLHAWALPELGIKIDAVPGRLNQFITFITYPGVFYGQCSELCGVDHGAMPIVVQAVPCTNFITWLIESDIV